MGICESCSYRSALIQWSVESCDGESCLVEPSRVFKYYLSLCYCDDLQWPHARRIMRSCSLHDASVRFTKFVQQLLGFGLLSLGRYTPCGCTFREIHRIDARVCDARGGQHFLIFRNPLVTSSRFRAVGQSCNTAFTVAWKMLQYFNDAQFHGKCLFIGLVIHLNAIWWTATESCWRSLEILCKKPHATSESFAGICSRNSTDSTRWSASSDNFFEGDVRCNEASRMGSRQWRLFRSLGQYVRGLSMIFWRSCVIGNSSSVFPVAFWVLIPPKELVKQNAGFRACQRAWESFLRGLRRLSDFLRNQLPFDETLMLDSLDFGRGFIHRLDTPSSGLILAATSLQGYCCNSACAMASFFTVCFLGWSSPQADIHILSCIYTYTPTDLYCSIYTLTVLKPDQPFRNQGL